MFRASLPINIRPEVTERVVEYQFALCALQFANGQRVLDIGQGPCPAFWYLLNTIGYVCTATDISQRGVIQFSYKGGTSKPPTYGKFPLFMMDDISQSKLPDGSFDVVFCISTLEHIPQFDAAVVNMHRLLVTGGLLVVSVPYSHTKHIHNVFAEPYHPKGTTGFTQSFSEVDVGRWRGMFDRTLHMEFWKCWTGGFWRQGKRLPVPKTAVAHQSDLVAFCVRK